MRKRRSGAAPESAGPRSWGLVSSGPAEVGPEGVGGHHLPQLLQLEPQVSQLDPQVLQLDSQQDVLHDSQHSRLCLNLPHHLLPLFSQQEPHELAAQVLSQHELVVPQELQLPHAVVGQHEDAWGHAGAHSFTVTGTRRQRLTHTVSGTHTGTFLHTVVGTHSVTVYGTWRWTV